VVFSEYNFKYNTKQNHKCGVVSIARTGLCFVEQAFESVLIRAKCVQRQRHISSLHKINHSGIVGQNNERKNGTKHFVLHQLRRRNFVGLETNNCRSNKQRSIVSLTAKNNRTFRFLFFVLVSETNANKEENQNKPSFNRAFKR
jgi:hypothetical protein